MTIEDVAKYFGCLTEACRQLGLSPSNLTTWKKYGYIPWLQQYRIGELTAGELMPDEVDPKSLFTKKG